MNSQTKTSHKFGEEYYNSGNYEHYSERAPRYHKTAIDISNLLQSVSLINKDSRILDFGCGFGFLSDGFAKIGYSNVSAFDTSEFAVSKAVEIGVNASSRISRCDIMIALDVFEHMADSDISSAIATASPDVIVCRIPVSLGDGAFHLEISKRDKTHINCKTSTEWSHFLMVAGYFSKCMNLNLSTVYSSPGVACLLLT